MTPRLSVAKIANMRLRGRCDGEPRSSCRDKDGVADGADPPGAGRALRTFNVSTVEPAPALPRTIVPLAPPRSSIASLGPTCRIAWLRETEGSSIGILLPALRPMVTVALLWQREGSHLLTRKHRQLEVRRVGAASAPDAASAGSSARVHRRSEYYPSCSRSNDQLAPEGCPSCCLGSIYCGRGGNRGRHCSLNEAGPPLDALGFPSRPPRHRRRSCRR